MSQSKKTRKHNNLIKKKEVTFRVVTTQSSNLTFKKNSIKVLGLLIKQTYRTFVDHKKFWLILILIFFIFNFIFVHGFNLGVNVSDYNNKFQKVFSGQSDKLINAGLSSLNVLISQPLNASAGVFYFFLIIFFINISLFALKKFNQPEDISIKQALYNGTSRLIPVLILIFFVFLALLPAIISVNLFSTVSNFAIDNSLISQIFWLGVFLAGILWSFYLIVVPLIGLVILINDDKLLPREAIRQAKQLTKHKKLLISLYLIIILIIVFVVFLVINLLVIVTISSLASLAYYVLTILIPPYLIVFVDNLYRKLKDESLSSQTKN